MYGSKRLNSSKNLIQSKISHNPVLSSLKILVSNDPKYETLIITTYILKILACRMRVEQANLVQNEKKVEARVSQIGT